jgi:outer membrane protein TolC
VGLLAHGALAQAQSLTPTAAPPNPMAEVEAQTLAARRAVTLPEALKLAGHNSYDLKAAQAQAAQVAAKAGLVYSALLPQVTLSTSYVRTSVEQKFDLSSLTDGFVATLQTVGAAYGLPNQANPAVLDAFKASMTTSPTVITATNSLYGSLVVQQVLFAPQFFLLPAAGESKEAARLGGLEAREQVLLATARVYLGLEGLAELERAAHDAEAVALRRERDAQAQATMGTSTEIAVLRAQVETAQARSTLATLIGQRISLLSLLETLTGEAVRPLEGQATQFEVKAADEDSSPWDQTYAVQSAKMAIVAQRRFNTFDRISWMPTLVVQGKGSYNSNKGFAGTNWIFDGIAAFQWELYDRGVRYATLHENDAKTAQYQAQLDGAKAKARATWVGAKANLAAARVALEQATRQAELAARAQKQLEGAFSNGMATSLEVSDMDSKRFFAASAAAQAHAQVQIRLVELAAAEGRLAELLGFTAD